MRIWLAVLHLLWGASSFAPPPARRAALARPAVPLAELPLREPLPALPAGHAFGVATRGDVVELVDLLMECFEDDVKVTLARELTPAERQMLEVPVGMWNLYTQLFARWEVDQGLRSRCGARLDKASLRKPSGSPAESLVLTVHGPGEDGAAAACLLGSVELRLQPVDGSVPSSLMVRLPQRAAAEDPAARAALRPYLCNLSVTASARRRGIAGALVSLCETVVVDAWAYRELYLHVDVNNTPAARLYDTRGYEVLPQFDVPAWRRRLFDLPYIRYHCKQLREVQTQPRALSEMDGPL